MQHLFFFAVHEVSFSVELIKLCLQVKSGVYCLERLCQRASFSSLAFFIISLYPSHDFTNSAVLFVFPFFQGQAQLSFYILFDVITDLIEMTGMIYKIWSLSSL